MLGKGAEILPSDSHTHTVIFLHGHGSNGSEFSDDFMCIEASDGRALAEYFPQVKWIFPSAPTSCIPDSEHADEMLQWFHLPDTEHPDSSEKDEAEQIATAARAVVSLVERESAIVGADNVILGGISQGCAIATYALLLGRRKLGGFIGLSSWLLSRETLRGMLDCNEALTTETFLAHCQDDDTIRIAHGYQLRDELHSFGMNVTWREYEDGGHWINDREGEHDIVDFLSQHLRG